MSYDRKVTRTIYTRADKVECPYCGADVEGWVGDPRGKETECDECDKTFMVADDAEIRMA